MAVLAGALLVLSLAGALLAAYFVAVTYRWMRPDPRWLPPVCRMEPAACARVVDTPEARVLGLPNAVYGLGWSALVAAWTLAGAPPAACLPLLVAALATVALGAYLVHALVVKLQTPCVLCFAAHAVNAAILVALAAACG